MKVEKTRVYGLEESLVASGYPMQADLFDNKIISAMQENEKVTDIVYRNANDKDYKRARVLGTTKSGEGHDQYLTGIVVQFDLTFSLKAWTEMQRYHFIDFVSSQSTMHRITQMNIDKCCNSYVSDEVKNNLKKLVDKYLETKDKEDYLRVLYNMPTGLELTARLTTNYRQLKTIYKQRGQHRLIEWREFCKWVETLPKFKELVLGE